MRKGFLFYRIGCQSNQYSIAEMKIIHAHEIPLGSELVYSGDKYIGYIDRYYTFYDKDHVFGQTDPFHSEMRITMLGLMCFSTISLIMLLITLLAVTVIKRCLRCKQESRPVESALNAEDHGLVDCDAGKTGPLERK
jgi:hypothetical protein